MLDVAFAVVLIGDDNHVGIGKRHSQSRFMLPIAGGVGIRPHIRQPRRWVKRELAEHAASLPLPAYPRRRSRPDSLRREQQSKRPKNEDQRKNITNNPIMGT